MCLLPPLLTPPVMKAVAALSVRRVAARSIKASVGRRGVRFVIMLEARVERHCERDEG